MTIQGDVRAYPCQALHSPHIHKVETCQTFPFLALVGVVQWYRLDDVPVRVVPDLQALVQRPAAAQNLRTLTNQLLQ